MRSARQEATAAGQLARTVGRPRGIRGFTLIELLVVTAILAVVVGVLAACIAGGVRAWDTARSVAAVEGEAVVGLRLIEKDLMNAFLFDGIGFSGQSRAVSFPALIRGEPTPAPGGGAIPSPGIIGEGALAGFQIGEVAYRFDGPAHRLIRIQSRYGAPEPAGAPEAILSNLRDVRFEYWLRPSDRGGGAGQWQGEWSVPTNLPDSVKIELVFENKPAPLLFSRTVNLPLGSGQAEGKP
jgi:prepilin-type N-terminal cleavage/methylation domain-containing protein